MRLFGKQVRVGNQATVDIVIYDECNSQYVRKILNPLYRVGIFRMRPYELWVSLKIVLNTVKCCSHFSLAEARLCPRGWLIGLLQQTRNIYFEACLVAMEPKAVVTLIDNTASFHWLSKHCRAFPFIAIQNGSRLRYALQEDRGYYLQHYFSWGTLEMDLFAQLGYQVENWHPVGSLLASLHFQQSRNTAAAKYDLLIVSTWRGDIGFPPDVVDTMRSMQIMDELLAQYIHARNIKAAVILRAERDSEHWIMPGIGTEYDYFYAIYRDNVDIIEANLAARSIYPVMQQSRLIISCLSSALNEAYGIGKKVLYCNFTGTNRYHCDIDPLIVTEDCDYQRFSGRLDGLYAQSDEAYQLMNQKNISRVMAFPSGSTTHRSIAEAIDRIIEDN